MSGKVHILWARGHYIGQVRGLGCRRWRTVTGRCKKAETALARAILCMHKSMDKRARALFIDSSPYYEPHVAMEASR